MDSDWATSVREAKKAETLDDVAREIRIADARWSLLHTKAIEAGWKANALERRAQKMRAEADAARALHTALCAEEKVSLDVVTELIERQRSMKQF